MVAAVHTLSKIMSTSPGIASSGTQNPATSTSKPTAPLTTGAHAQWQRANEHGKFNKRFEYQATETIAGLMPHRDTITKSGITNCWR